MFDEQNEKAYLVSFLLTFCLLTHFSVVINSEIHYFIEYLLKIVDYLTYSANLKANRKGQHFKLAKEYS